MRIRSASESFRHTRRPKGLLVVFVCFALAAVGIAQGSSNPPVRIIAEAEDFSVREGGWGVVPYRQNYFASTFAITFLSRMACLGAPAQTEEDHIVVAEERIEVPETGEYLALARYEQPYGFSVEFTLEIEQKGKVLHRYVFGRLEDAKIWPFSKGIETPMKRWFWGGGDNIVWQRGGTVRLAPGSAVLRLMAGPQMDGNLLRSMAARRNVDVICLTTDEQGFVAQTTGTAGRKGAEYLPLDGWLVQDGDLYVRVTNPKDGLGPCTPVISPYPSGQHSPFWVHLRDWPSLKLVRSGALMTPARRQLAGPHSASVKSSLLAPIQEVNEAQFKKVSAAEFLQPGETSGWVPMGDLLDALHFSKWMPQAVYAPGITGGKLDLELEFAIPDGKGGLKPVKKSRVTGRGAYPHSPISFEIPGNILADPHIRTHVETLNELNSEIDRFPRKGSIPKRIPIFGIMGFSGVLRAEGELGRLATEIALKLGDNTLTPTGGPAATASGAPRRRTVQAVGHWAPTVKGVDEATDKLERNGTLDQLRLVSYGDEHYIPPSRIDATEYAAWLKDRNIPVSGAPVVTSDPSHPQYYYSQLCAFEKGVREWAAATRRLKERTDSGAVAGVNYGPASHNMVDEVNFVRALRLKGVSVAWSEDYVWQMPEFSVQVTGYRVSGFRAGAKYNQTPILMYIMPHSPGNTPRDCRLSYYTAVAHGTTLIHFYCATPSSVGQTENYIDTRDVAMFRTIYELTHETGIFEDYVIDGVVRPAQVGLLLSSVDDLRNPSPLDRGGHHNAERKAAYYALRHAQVPVDFLSEDDVIEGRADPYRLIYVTQEYLHSEAVKALTGWVRCGGTLVALCGGGFLDEFNRPNPEAATLYGVKSQSILKDDRFPNFHFKQDLPPYDPLALASWELGGHAVSNIPVILWRQNLTPSDGRVIGTFDSCAPAVLEKIHGKGRAILFGFMPGLAYLKSGLPLQPWDRGSTDNAFAHFLPTAMNRDLRRAFVDHALPPDYVRPVECSEPLVETTCIDTLKPARRLAVPLMNFTGKSIPSLTVTVCDVPRAVLVQSVERGLLKPEFKNGAMTVNLPLDITDMLLIDR